LENYEVGNAVEIERGLFGAEAPVQVGSNAHVAGISGNLADMVDVFADFLDAQIKVLGLGGAVAPFMNHHDRVKCHSDDGSAFNELPDLGIGQLAVPSCEGAAVVVAGPDRSLETRQGIGETFVTEMGDVENKPEAFHFLEQFPSSRGERAGVVGAMAINAWTIVNWAECDKSVGAGFFKVFPAEDGVGSFEAEEVADGKFGCLFRIRKPPEVSVSRKFGPGAELFHFPQVLHGSVVTQLTLGVGPSLFRGAPSWEAVELGRVARDLSGDDDADPPLAQFWETHRISTAVREAVGGAEFGTSDIFEGPALVAVELHGVHGNVEVGVKNEAGLFQGWCLCGFQEVY